jgi:hypothetical protein
MIALQRMNCCFEERFGGLKRELLVALGNAKWFNSEVHADLLTPTVNYRKWRDDSHPDWVSTFIPNA